MEFSAAIVERASGDFINTATGEFQLEGALVSLFGFLVYASKENPDCSARLCSRLILTHYIHNLKQLPNTNLASILMGSVM